MISLQVKERLKKIPGVTEADVRIVWQPEWNPSRMSEEAKRKVGWNR
jgi:metal-sulfur cluster biosynthetic enzyme